MYTSIDSVAHALNRKLKKYKERRTEGWHGGGHMGDDLAIVLEELDEPLPEEEEEIFDDPEKPTVLKVNSFQTDKAISLDEAVFALDYVDHDFYVFRNQESNKINVVYKRHEGVSVQFVCFCLLFCLLARVFSPVVLSSFCHWTIPQGVGLVEP